MRNEETSGFKQGQPSPPHFSVRDVFAVLVLWAVVALFLGPALLPGRVLMPLDIVTQGWPPWQEPNRPVEVHNWLLTDVVNYIFPVKQFMVESVREGTLPLWNPYVLTGYPFTYNTQAGLFYPLSLLYYIFPWYTAVDATIGLQLALGALFMYAYLRLLVQRRLAAMAGALLFALNGLMVVWLEWQVVHAAIIWLPLQLYFVERMVRTAGSKTAWIHAILAGIAFALPWLGGHWNWALYTSMTVAVYALWRLVPHFRQQGSLRQRGQLLALYLLPLVTGTALALVQVWPAFNYLSQTHRRPLPFRDLLLSGLWDRAVVLLIPNFFGNPSHDNNWWGIDNFNETTFYLGILPLFLIALALFLRRDAITWFFAIWGFIGLLWTLGTPLYGLLYLLPMFKGLYPGRAAILVVICGSVLAALALDRLLERRIRWRRQLWRVISLTGLLFLLMGAVYGLAYQDEVLRTAAYLAPYLTWGLFSLLVSGALLWARVADRLHPRPFGIAVLVWMVLDLYLLAHGYNTVSQTADFYPQSGIVNYLQQDPELFRIVTPAEGIVFYPNTSLLARIGNASGYEPGLPRRHVDLYNAMEGESAIRFNRILMPLHGLNSPLLDMMNVKYITTINDQWQGEPAVDIAQQVQDEWIPLGLENPAGQTFTTTDAGLHRVDIPLRLSEGTAGTITLRVLSGDGGLELAHATLDAATLPAESWQSFFFEAFPSEWGREFRLTLSFDGTGEAAAGMSTNDVYPAGTRLQGNEPATGDMAFVTHYLPRPALAYEEGKTRIYVNEGYQPRAYARHQAVAAATQEEALALLLENVNRLDEVVVLEPAGEPLLPAASVTSTVTITEYHLNEVSLQAEMAAPGYVVLADTYYPGWQATVDGEAVPIYQANYIFRAVPVDAGQHTIVFTFRPLDFITGAWISGLTFLFVLAALVVLVWHVRRGERA